MNGTEDGIKICIIEDINPELKKAIVAAMNSCGSVAIVPSHAATMAAAHDRAYTMSMDTALERDWTGFLMEYGSSMAVPAGRTLEQHNAILALNKGRKGPHTRRAHGKK